MSETYSVVANQLRQEELAARAAVIEESLRMVDDFSWLRIPSKQAAPVCTEYLHNGNAGFFFDIYAPLQYSSMRKTPSTREELINAGLADENVDEYFDLIYQLYGCGYILQNGLHGTEIGPDMPIIWADLCNFCFDFHLINAPCNSDIHYLYRHFSSTLFWPLLVNCSNDFTRNLPPISVDEFRWHIELILAGLRHEWYLALRYGVYLARDESSETIILKKLSTESNSLLPMSTKEIYTLIHTVRKDRHDLDAELTRVVQHKPLHPAHARLAAKRGIPLKSNNLPSRVVVKEELYWLCDCDSCLKNIIYSGGRPHETQN